MSGSPTRRSGRGWEAHPDVRESHPEVWEGLRRPTRRFVSPTWRSVSPTRRSGRVRNAHPDGREAHTEVREGSGSPPEFWDGSGG